MPKKPMTFRRWLIFSIPVVLIVILGSFAYAASTSGKSPDGDHSDDLPPNYQMILDHIQQNGSVIILVGYDPSYQVTPMAVNTPLSGFDLIHQLLVQDLSPYNVIVSEATADWVIPYIAIRNVDEAAFRHILELPYITAIQEDIQESPGIVLPTPT